MNKRLVKGMVTDIPTLINCGYKADKTYTTFKRGVIEVKVIPHRDIHNNKYRVRITDINQPYIKLEQGILCMSHIKLPAKIKENILG
jgi:hypothetical protein